MALTHSVNFTFVDGKGARSTTSINLPTGLDYGDMIAAAGSIAQLLANVSLAQLVNVSLCVGVDISLLTSNAAPGDNVDVEEGARFIYTTTNGYRTSMRIPGFDEAKLIAGTQLVDETDADVIALISVMETGYSGIVDLIAPSDSHGDDIVALASAREDFQKTRKI